MPTTMMGVTEVINITSVLRYEDAVQFVLSERKHGNVNLLMYMVPSNRFKPGFVVCRPIETQEDKMFALSMRIDGMKRPRVSGVYSLIKTKDLLKL